jgi:hypothetical protein
MKKLIVFLILALLSSFGYSRSNVLPTPNQVLSGDTIFVCTVPVCSGVTESFHLFSSFGFQTSCSYSCQGVRYYTTEPYIVLTFNVVNDTTIMCYVDSVNDVPLNKVKAIAFSISVPPSIFIPVDSINHVTCPNGYLHPYGDGSFHVDLLDPVQDYTYVKVRSDSSFFFEHTYYDDFTVSGLRGGAYQVEALGTNGCVYHDSVVIEQPEAWYFNMDSVRVDTVCYGQTGCNSISTCGGTPPYNFTWSYYSDTGQVYMSDTTRLVCGLSSGQVYYVSMYDSRGCKAWGDETDFIIVYIYEYVEDTTHIITIDPIACYGHEFIVQAQSIGVGTYTWTIGNVDDSTNYWTSIYGDSMFVADYMTPPLFQPTYVVATFSDQHGCVTQDSIWVDVYDPGLSLSIETQDIITDSACVIHVSPLGGSLYLDGMLIVENVPDPYTLSTSGISVEDHTLKYAGVFGMEQGLYCEEEVEVSFNVQSHPFVTDWDQEISIYPNPATTTLNLSSTEMMDFTICITDVTGRVVLREKVLDSFYPVDVSSLTSGIYLFRRETPEGATKTVKFVKR